MSKPVVGLGSFIVLMGVLLFFVPDRFLNPTDWESRGGLFLAASIRIVTGLILIFGAAASRYPVGLRVFGAVVLLAGLVLLFLPLELWAGLLRWAFGKGTTLIRAGSVGGVLLGLFLVHAGRPRGHAP